MVLALVASLQTPAAAQGSGPYTDVAADAYYAMPVNTLAADGVLTGTDCGEDLFCPGKPIERWQAAVWIVRVLDGRDPPSLHESRFWDVDDDAWWMPYVERMYELGVTYGCGDGRGFCPHASVTRAEMAVFLTRAFDLPAGPAPGFADVPADAWYADQVAALAASGITAGCGDGTRFCPGRNTTKAEMATFLDRGLKWMEANGSGTEDNELSRWVKSGIVDRYGTEAPWLREVWNYTDRPSFRYIPQVHPTTQTHGTVVARFTTGGGDVFPQVESYELYAHRVTINNPVYNSILIHELAHVYTIDGYRVAKSPEAIAAGWLYFDLIAGSNCDPLELYAETAEALEPFDRRNLQWRWWECPNLPDTPTDEAVGVVSQAFSGRLPDWFHDRFQEPDGEWDYDEIWRQVKFSSPSVRAIVVPMLRHSFGGYCSEEAVRQTLFASERRPHLTQPWRDGGCEELGTSKNPELRTEENELSRWVKSAVIDEYSTKWPWLKEAWDYTNRPNFEYLPAGNSGSWQYPYQYIWAWREPEETGDVFRLLASDGLSVAQNTLKNNYLHEPTYELARMYIYNYDLAKNPEAVVAGWLYFTSIAGYDCDPTGLYVDTAISLEPDFIDKEFWWEWEWAVCPHLPNQPTAESLQVARQVFSGQVPDWFHINFKDTNGQWDYQKIWSAVINTINTREVLLPMLRHSFGGYCSEQDVSDALYRVMLSFGSLLSPVRMAQPWRDGGCGQELEAIRKPRERSSPNSGFMTERNDLSLWIKNDIVDGYSAEAPWLQEIWNYTNQADFEYIVARQQENSVLGRIFEIGSASSYAITIRGDTFPILESQAIYVSEYVIGKSNALFYPISELAEVYITDAGEAANSPEAVAAGWLYFASLGNCSPQVLYTDTVTFVQPFQRTLESDAWKRCPHLPNKPTEEAKQVVSQAFSGQIPDWFHANFKKADGQWDYEKIWVAIKDSPIRTQVQVVPILRHSFGGYCSETAVRDALFRPNPASPRFAQPWRDGGC